MEFRILSDAAALTLAVPPLRRRGRGHRSERRDEGRARGRPRAARLDRQALRAGHDHRSDRRLAHRPVHGPADDRRRTSRVRTLRAASRPRSARIGNSSSCRPTPGRPTTSTTPTETAGATRGTREARRPSISLAPTATAVCHPATSATTSATSSGCNGRGRRPTSSRTTISRRSRPATTSVRSTTSSSSQGTAST